MPRKPWVQPLLDGGAIQKFRITARFVWPGGWEAACEIVQEPLRFGWTEVSRLTEGSSQELEAWMRLVTLFCANAGD